MGGGCARPGAVTSRRRAAVYGASSTEGSIAQLSHVAVEASTVLRLPACRRSELGVRVRVRKNPSLPAVTSPTAVSVSVRVRVRGRGRGRGRVRNSPNPNPNL